MLELLGMTDRERQYKEKARYKLLLFMRVSRRVQEFMGVSL